MINVTKAAGIIMDEIIGAIEDLDGESLAEVYEQIFGAVSEAEYNAETETISYNYDEEE